jgi:hypothetical protein
VDHPHDFRSSRRGRGWSGGLCGDWSSYGKRGGSGKQMRFHQRLPCSLLVTEAGFLA